MANAFAAVRLWPVQEFHLSRPSTDAPVRLCRSWPSSALGNRCGRRSSSTIPCLIVPTFKTRSLGALRFVQGRRRRRPARRRDRRKAGRNRRARPTPPTDARGKTRCRGRGGAGRRPTTSFLTATTLIYAIGAGITAGAGTRLVLRSILARAFASRSFRTPDPVKGAPPR